MIKIPTVSTFCGCIDLKVACIVIAVLRLVFSIYLAIICFLAFFELIEIEQKIEELGIDDRSVKLKELWASCKHRIIHFR